MKTKNKNNNIQPIRRSSRVTKKTATQENNVPTTITNLNDSNTSFTNMSDNAKSKNKRKKVLEINNNFHNNEIEIPDNHSSDEPSQKKLRSENPFSESIQTNITNENQIVTETLIYNTTQEETEEIENFTNPINLEGETNYFQFLENQKLTDESDSHSDYNKSDHEYESSSEKEWRQNDELQSNLSNESDDSVVFNQETLSKDKGIPLILVKILKICQETQSDTKGLQQTIDSLEKTVTKQKEEIQKLNDALKSFKGSGNHINNVNWIEPYWRYMIVDLFPENKYPSEEVLCETTWQVLTQRQPERMRIMMQSGQWDAFFRSTISSVLKEKMSKYRGDQVKKIKAALFDCFPKKIPKFNSKTDPNIISEFKKSNDAKWCLRHLNSRISSANPTKYIDRIVSSFTKDRSVTDSDQLFSIAVCRFMLDETVIGVTLDPERMDSLMRGMKKSV
ncbi:unnamed protein product [Rhizophagus irregularis]|uniref:Uncharacterized protein n=1 Tax=Rhizophagus irregularis TaxID=588596 RepID=A0A916EG94_9GLOM|nr:unnamed protein product [Rhizophagus irregularis]